MEGPPLDCFSADQPVELWWHDCCTTRRVNQGPRKPYQPREKEDSNAPGPSTMPEQESDPEEVRLVLDDWDEWFKSPEDSEMDDSCYDNDD